ncbi:hypothetical protein T439DRAFT_322632 [Meredithblackwellia eburnea MCA 4105]
MAPVGVDRSKLASSANGWLSSIRSELDRMTSREALWPPLHPPLLTRLPQPPKHADPNSVAPSMRYRAAQRTLQDDADVLDYEEEAFALQQTDTRNYGFTWLIPLGRQNTQEEDAESTFSPSPRPETPGMDQTVDEPQQVEGVATEGAVGAATGGTEGEGEGERDLDADIESVDSEPEPEPEEDDDEDENEDDDQDQDEDGDLGEEDGDDLIGSSGSGSVASMGVE